MILSLTVEDNIVSNFFQLTRAGFSVKVKPGSTIKELVCNQLNVSEQYLEERIQTIFLDGKPVDDVNSTLVTEGSTLALSASMPGLAGATLRKGGYFGALRKSITHEGGDEIFLKEGGEITLKLFNLIVRDMAPYFLEQGICLKGEVLKDFFVNQQGGFWKGCKSIELDDREAERHILLEGDWGKNKVLLKVKADL